jgi:hypothetical protein
VETLGGKIADDCVFPLKLEPCDAAFGGFDEVFAAAFVDGSEPQLGGRFVLRQPKGE